MASSRLAIGQALVTLLAGFTYPSNSQPLYGPGTGAVKLGAMFDPTSFTNAFCEVLHHSGRIGRAGSGGNQVGWRVEDHVTFLLGSGIGPYESDDSTAQANMLALQDAMLPALLSHYQLPQASNPTLSVASTFSLNVEQVDRSRPIPYPNGHVYLIWDVFVTVKQQFGIIYVNP